MGDDKNAAQWSTEAVGRELRSDTRRERNCKAFPCQQVYRLPFGGGSGAGVSISPVAFLVVQPNNVKLLPVNHSSAVDRLLDYVPDLMEKMNSYLNKTMQNKKEEKKEEMKIAERERREAKETMENLAETVQNINKIHPRKSRVQKPQQYEFEYDETEDDFRDDEQDENE